MWSKNKLHIVGALILAFFLLYPGEAYQSTWSAILRTECVGLGRAGHTTPRTPCLVLGNPRLGAGVVVSARASSLRQPGSRALHFCAHLAYPYPPSRPLPPTLGWAGVKRRKRKSGPSPARFLPSAAEAGQPWAGHRARMGSACLSKRGSLTPCSPGHLREAVCRPNYCRQAHVTGLIVYPGSYTASQLLHCWVARAPQSPRINSDLLHGPQSCSCFSYSFRSH